jgi:thiol-disulfide isomerase/thioredoxin
MINRTNIIFAVIILGAVLFFFLGKTKTGKGKLAPEITATLDNGSAFQLSDMKGKYVLVDFWGSWCPPCRRENPNLVKLYDKYNTKDFKNAAGFEILSIAIEKNKKRVHAAIKKDGLRWPYHIIEQSGIVLTNPLALKYGVTDLPSKFLIDTDGNIVSSTMSIAEIDAYLAEQ